MSDYSDEQIKKWIDNIRYGGFYGGIDWGINSNYPQWVYYKESNNFGGFVKIPQVFPSKTDKLIFNPSINPMTAELIEQIEMFWN